jgi:hypothetical protein
MSIWTSNQFTKRRITTERLLSVIGISAAVGICCNYDARQSLRPEPTAGRI